MSADAGAPGSQRLFARAERVIPGGVNSPVRAFGSVGGTPRFIARGEGATIEDVDGRRYIDYVNSWGPLILGHARAEVLAAAHAALDRGSSFGAPTAAEVELAEEITGRLDAVDQVRCVSSGTEATMSAIRLARGFTGRHKLVKFAGHYHGHADALLVAAGSGVATFGLPDSPGVTPGAAADTIVLPWNDVAAVDELFATLGDQIAVVICEPVAANMGVVPPVDGFLQLLRDRTAQHGALLVFDEVLTGFRVARGGACEIFGITPDLVALGKVVGGGFPLAAFGGRADIMAQLAPSGPVYQAGTLSGNPVAVAAGLAQLRLLDDAAYDGLQRRAEIVLDGFAKAFAEYDIAVQLPRVRSLAGLFFADAPVRDFDGAKAADHDRYARFFHGMLARGIYLPPSGYEALFFSLAQTDDDLDATVQAAFDVAGEIAGDLAGDR
jgi:glutamate-1-semialdehyde 2,1-aminomutase